MADDKLQKKGLNHVLDEETNEVVEISDGMRRMAQTVQQRIDGATMVTAILLQVVRDQKLYLAWGCGSFKEYSDTMLPFNRQTAYKYITIAEKFAPILPEFKVDGSVSSMRQLEENISENEQINQMSGIGMTKLYEIANIPDSDVKDLSEGTFEINGKEYTWDDIKAQTVRDLQDEVREEKRKLQKRLANSEEDLKKAEGERDHFKSQLEKQEEDQKRTRELEAKYGKKVTHSEEIKFNLNKAENALNDLERYFSKVEVGDEEEDESLRQRVLSILRSALQMHEMAKRRMPWLIDKELEESSAFPAAKLDQIKNRAKSNTAIDPESDEFDPDSTVEGV